MIERRVTINPDTWFFNNVYMPVVRSIEHPKTEAMVLVTNKERSTKVKKEIKERYKFMFEYQDDNKDIIGIEVLYMGEE